MGIEKVEKIWVDGALVNWDEATEHVLAHTLHYGLGAFEGIRSYKREDGRVVVFRLAEHIARLFESCHICSIDVPFSRDELERACIEVLQANHLDSAYLRPLIYLGSGALGLGSAEAPVRTIIAAFRWGAYLGDEGLRRGIRCKVSAFRRGTTDSIMSKGKICGQYTTSVLAKRDALKNGYDEAILLDTYGQVAEGSGENIFVVKQGIIRTPPLSASILAGITRNSVLVLAKELGHPVTEQAFTIDDLWTAEEVFMTGTAAEITPVREVDGRTIGTGSPGPITQALQQRFFAVVTGTDTAHSHWLTDV